MVEAVFLTLRLAALSTAILLAIGVPLALWLAAGRSRLRNWIHAVVALPLVLPPTVLGFYLLLALGPRSWVGSAWQAVFGEPLVFSFSALVLGSVVYSLPFVVQPLVSSFASVPRALLEAAASLGVGRSERIIRVVLPLSRSGLLVASVLGFAHTVGEFGVVLMIGGNIPGHTRVLSIAIYDHVEAQNYAPAHWLSGGLVLFSMSVLVIVYTRARKLGILTS